MWPPCKCDEQQGQIRQKTSHHLSSFIICLHTVDKGIRDDDVQNCASIATNPNQKITPDNFFLSAIASQIEFIISSITLSLKLRLFWYFNYS